MFHFSTDRLAGLDSMILKISSPPKVPTPIPNHALDHDTYIPVRKPRKQKQPRETRPPLVDRTASSNLTSPMLLHIPPTVGEVKLLAPDDYPSYVPPSPNVPSFRPLPPLPSASTLQLPSFLNFSDHSVTSLVDPSRRATASLPASALFNVSSSPVAPPCGVVVRKTRNNKVFEGPQWIPAFHHPNSPYVPWSLSDRQRILPPPSPLSPSPVCPSSPCIRSGAVAPEPWSSSTFSQAYSKSRKEKLSSSWKSLKDSIKQVKSVVSHIARSGMSLRMLCTGQDVLRTYDDTHVAAAQPDLTSDTMRSEAQHSGPRDSLASFASSDSRTLAAWLAERRANASCLTEDTLKAMSVEEYELMGSWLGLRSADGGWVCGIQECDMHTAGGSPYAASEYSDGLRTAMPFDSTDLRLIKHPSPGATPLTTPPSAFPTGPFCVLPRFHSLPCLPCQTFEIYSAPEAKSTTLNDVERCLARHCQFSMPSGGMFT